MAYYMNVPLSKAAKQMFRHKGKINNDVYFICCFITLVNKNVLLKQYFPIILDGPFSG